MPEVPTEDARTQQLKIVSRVRLRSAAGEVQGPWRSEQRIVTLNVKATIRRKVMRFRQQVMDELRPVETTVGPVELPIRYWDVASSASGAQLVIARQSLNRG